MKLPSVIKDSQAFSLATQRNEYDTQVKLLLSTPEPARFAFAASCAKNYVIFSVMTRIDPIMYAIFPLFIIYVD